MLLLRGFLLFASVYATISEFSDRDELLAGITETRERLEVLTEALRDYVMENAPSTERPTTLPPTTPLAAYSNCKEILDAGHTEDGYYPITTSVSPLPFPVYCDMTTDGGGWLVFQRRFNGSEPFFNRSYAEYARGFGDPYQADFWGVNDVISTIKQYIAGELRNELEESITSVYQRRFGVPSETYADELREFWMGNDVISTITHASPTELRIEMTDWEDNKVYAKYSRFEVARAEDGYRMTLKGEYNGTAGDSLGYHHGGRFSSYDVDHDDSTHRNCAASHGGGWWFKNCRRANLNGRYIPGGAHESVAEGIAWSRFRGLKYSLKTTEMKMRPVA